MNTIYKRAVTYTWIMLHCFFAKSCNLTVVFKKFLGVFAAKELWRIEGENLVITKKEVLAIWHRLHATSDLLDETSIDIQNVLQNYSIQD